jgi:hypothetical protein
MDGKTTEIWLSLARVAVLTGKSERTVRRMIASGQYEVVKVPLTTRRGETRKTFIRVSGELSRIEFQTRQESGQRIAGVLKTEEVEGAEPVVRLFMADVEVEDEA